ncbi:MAG: nucleotide exchange factor GrpE [Deltaproteobacteria bacterium RBG_16_50_11]|nr:MAG: nucleotide exchange factor GrpE [Deltaproteobacteria bacterium RBG_16_50_11]
MSKKEKKETPHQTDSDKGQGENLLETIGQELRTHIEEDRKEKEKEIEELKKRLEGTEKEAKDHYERLLRMAADFDNYKKRAVKEKEDWVKFSNEDLLKAILPFIDNLERAVNHAEKVKDTGVMIEGVRLTLQQLHQILNRFGVSPIESIGKPFDPTFHEAMLMVETDKHEPNQVVEEFQKGYLLNDRLLRPATVSVSKPPAKEA